ncbi:DEAD/DEAH box helicase [Streptomyces sp.]|uniref:DEAD/DEAH box helicase n=1 Tax=Streptomyces sp. TaxID=1931 RepID=UPI002F92F7D2
MAQKRCFTGRERTALYLAADGLCEKCGAELDPGWHGDHVIPYSRGGKTDLINGQALCPPCNLKKGNTVSSNLREWQQEATERFLAKNARDFLVCATPGAGKTTFAISLANRLIDNGVIGRVMVVVPTDALRQQWADAAGERAVHLMPVDNANDYDKAGYVGCVVTYQQLAMGTGADLARRAMRRPTMVILDEIHHAGDSRTWGDALNRAAEHATYRLALTGTPWRRDNNPIPFVKYDDNGGVKVDYAYEYGSAVADGVCRRIEFHAYDGEARWIDHARARREARDPGPGQANYVARLGEDLHKEDVPAVLETIFHPQHAWIPDILGEAIVALEDLRVDIPDAAGLVITDTKWQADEYALILKSLNGGVMPTVVVSDPANDPGSKLARKKIEDFRKSRDRWIIAVRMISEGVDIPRLAVGVYVSKVSTPLFFRQVVGRFVRVRKGEEFNARLLIPALPELMQYARAIEDELRHQIEAEAEAEEKARAEREGAQMEFDLREPVYASEATFDRAILGGEETFADGLERAKTYCASHGIPLQYAVNIAPLLRTEEKAPDVAPAAPASEAVPRHRREKMLRGEVETLARRLSKRRNIEPKDVNTALFKKFGPRSKASVELLEEMVQFLNDQLGML